MTSSGYVHGYDPRENDRLQDQAATLVALLHSDTVYQAGCRVLEAGCGVGAQTVTLASNSPETQITSVDIAMSSVSSARQAVREASINNVRFVQSDIFNLPFAEASFDHIFVCFVLEHLAQPVAALQRLKSLLKKDGTITVIEGDHGSAYFHPDSDAARKAIRCQVRLQQQAGGNAMIGRALYPMLDAAGFQGICVSPRMVYVDHSKPELVDGFTRRTFTAMVEGVRESAIASNMITPDFFDQGVKDLYRTCEPDGVFCYTFFKAIGLNPKVA